MTDKRANFERISTKRKLEIMTLISKLPNLTNKWYYEYTQEELQNLFKELYEALDDARKKAFDEYRILGGEE